MAIPVSRQTLIDYCFRILGYPVIEINVDDDQVEDRIDDALQFYQTYHSDSYLTTYFKHQITQEDFDAKSIQIPDEIFGIRQILPLLRGTSGSLGMFDARYQIMLSDMYSLGFSGELADYVHVQKYLSTINLLLGSGNRFRFNRHQGRLILDVDWGTDITVGDFIIAEADRIIDPAESPKIWNDYFLKKYATALIKRQWGINLKKFEGIQLPGGITMNGQQMFDEANEELQRLEEEARSNWEEPLGFLVG